MERSLNHSFRVVVGFYIALYKLGVPNVHLSIHLFSMFVALSFSGLGVLATGSELDEGVHSLSRFDFACGYKISYCIRVGKEGGEVLGE